MPEIFPANSRGFTTQKIVPSVISGPASAVVATVMTTCDLSGASSRLLTVPNTMSLYLSCDWPACSPSPLSNEILIVGPSFDSVSQASHAPTATATRGTIQMIENRRERCVAACGRVRCSARFVITGLPLDGSTPPALVPNSECRVRSNSGQLKALPRELQGSGVIGRFHSALRTEIEQLFQFEQRDVLGFCEPLLCIFGKIVRSGSRRCRPR